MKRLRVILLFLLLGVIVNVAVAWVGFKFSENSKGIFERRVPTGEAEHNLWSRYAVDGWPNAPTDYRRWYGLLASGRHIGSDPFITIGIRTDLTNAELRERQRGIGAFEVWQINSGFPLRSMRTVEWSGNPLFTRVFTSTAGHDAFDFVGFRFPKRLLWSGVIINTVFYVLLLRLLFATPGQIRGKIRHKRGLCVKCAYDLRGAEHEACPECGQECLSS